MTRLIALIASIAALALLVVTYVYTRPNDGDQFAQCRATSIAGGAGAIGGPFELMTAQGEMVTDKDVITEPTLVYFGYTFCPDVCPFDLARNADAMDILDGKGDTVNGLFITIDPARDTPEVVGDYAGAFHDRITGLTGTPDQISTASKAYKTYYKAHAAEDEFYLVDHSTFTYLMLPEVGFVDFFRRDVSAEAMAERVGCFIDQL